MRLYERMLDKEEELAVVGLGYVGLPLAVEFSNHFKVIGFDTNSEKINLYKRGYDPTKDVGDDKLKNASVNFTFDEEELKRAKFYVVAVPTPINEDNTPNLTPVEEATRTVARNLTKGDIVVYESTVYPGTTEEVCVPILEKISGLKYGSDFKVG